MAIYTYTIFDADPASASACALLDEDIEIESRDDTTIASDVEGELEVAAFGMDRVHGYVPGDRLYLLVWDSGGVMVHSEHFELTEEHLGPEEADEDESEDDEADGGEPS